MGGLDIVFVVARLMRFPVGISSNQIKEEPCCLLMMIFYSIYFESELFCAVVTKEFACACA